MTRLLPRLALLLGALAVLSLGWLAGTCYYFGFCWIAREDFLPGILATFAGCGVAMLALLVAAEVGVAYRRAVADGKPVRKVEHCAACNVELRQPGAWDEYLRGNLCPNCDGLMKAVSPLSRGR